MLAERMNTGFQFSELSRELHIESSGKLAFHLEKMQDLIFQENEGRYSLTEKGQKAVEAIKLLGVSSTDDSNINILSSRVKVSTGVENNNMKVQDPQSNEDLSVSEINNDRLPFGKFLLIGVMLQILFLIVFPVLMGLIVAAISDNDTAFFLTFILIATIDALILGILFTLIIHKKGNTSLKEDFGLAIFALNSWLYILSPLLITGGSYSVLITIMILAIYLVQALGSWISINLISSFSYLNSFPRGFHEGRNNLKFVILLITSLPIMRFDYTYSTIRESSSYSETIAISTSYIGIRGLSYLILFTTILLLFKNNKIIRNFYSSRHRMKVAAIISILNSITFSLIFYPKWVWDKGINNVFPLIIIISLATISSIIGIYMSFNLVKVQMENKM